MDGPGPSTQANRAAAAARAARATRRASGQASKRVEESSSARVPPRGRRAEEDPAEEGEEGSEEESSEDEDDEEEGGEEKPPVHHHEIWRKLLTEASQGGQLQYVNRQPESGIDPLDITAPERSQITWDMSDRQHWPDILTLWDRPRPWNNPTYEIGVMTYKGRVVLDFADRPIRNFRIPATISSKVEGLRMEAWLRADNRITFADIEARTRTKIGSKGKIEPVFDKRSLSKRASLARQRAGLISWVHKRGREAQTEFMDNLRTQGQKDNNLATDKDLDPAQKAQHQLLGLDQDKKSNAPTRPDRISKIKRTAATGGTVAGPSSAAATAGPSDPVAATSGDNDDLTDDTDVGEALQEPHIQDQAPEDDTDDEGSVSSSLIDPQDSRHDQPTNDDEVVDLRRALENTRVNFRDWAGQEPQPTNPGDNYFSQWGMLQEQFRHIWESRGNPGEAPRLRARDRWTGGISQWYLAEEIGEWVGQEESE